MQRKQCSKCNEHKTHSEFSPAKGSTAKDGLHSRCKDCRKKDERERRRAKGTPDLVEYFSVQAELEKQGMRLCSKCHEIKPLEMFGFIKAKAIPVSHCRECGKKATASWRSKNVETCREKSRIHYKNNPEYYKQWRDANKERQILNHKAWYEKNRDQKLKQNAEWINNNPGYSKRRASIRRKAVKAENVNLQWLQDRDTHCYLCENEIDYSLVWPDPMSKSIDHIIPLSKGGSHIVENVAYTHLHCNISKGSKIGKLC